MSTPDRGAGGVPTGGGTRVAAVLLWLLVGVGLLYGVFEAIRNAAKLFG